MRTTRAARFPFRLASAAALFVACFARGANADEPVTDQDRRATMALWNSVESDPSKHKLVDIKPENVQRLDLYRPKNESGAREFALRYGAPAPDGSGRGFHKILIGGTPVDPVAKGWTLHLTLKEPAAEVWMKRIEKSDAERYVEWAVRGMIGNVMMTVVDRRPIAEVPVTAVGAVSKRHHALVAAARAAGLFARTRATLYVGVGEDTGTVLGEGPPPLMSVRDEGAQYRLRLEMLSADDAPVEAKWFKIVLSGPLAEFATVEGALARPTAGTYVVPNPGLGKTVLINVPPTTPELDAALLEHTESGSTEPPLWIEVSAKQK